MKDNNVIRSTLTVCIIYSLLISERTVQTVEKLKKRIFRSQNVDFCALRIGFSIKNSQFVDDYTRKCPVLFHK
jgi:hypothetical protein